MKTNKTLLTMIAMAALGASAQAAPLAVSSLELPLSSTVKPNVLVQGWATGNENSTSKDQPYRLRRAEIKASGVIAGAPRYFMMVDPAKLIAPPGAAPNIPAKNMIQDFGLSYAPVAGLEVTAGQFKAPTTAEGLDSSAELPLPERSLSGRTYGDRRELGARVAYREKLWNVASMVSTGQQITTDLKQKLQDLHTRAELTPAKDLAVGAFITLGNDFDYSSKGRWGVNARYKVGQADLRAEYGHGKDLAQHSNGYTTEAGYWITQDIEPVARFEAFSPNEKFGNIGEAETIGVNYLIRDYNTKIQVAGTAMQNMAAINGSPATVKGQNNKAVTLVLQASL